MDGSQEAQGARCVLYDREGYANTNVAILSLVMKYIDHRKINTAFILLQSEHIIWHI